MSSVLKVLTLSLVFAMATSANAATATSAKEQSIRDKVNSILKGLASQTSLQAKEVYIENKVLGYCLSPKHKDECKSLASKLKQELSQKEPQIAKDLGSFLDKANSKMKATDYPTARVAMATKRVGDSCASEGPHHDECCAEKIAKKDFNDESCLIGGNATSPTTESSPNPDQNQQQTQTAPKS